jgi:pimeloyl-ACP methyl ester carboxylesterase
VPVSLGLSGALLTEGGLNVRCSTTACFKPSGGIFRPCTRVDSSQKFFFMGYCIGGPFALKLMERAPDRVVAAVCCQPVGHRPDNPDYMYNSGKDVWAPELLKRRPDLDMATIEKYLHNLYRIQPDFVYSVSRDFVRNCQTPILVLPDDTPAHPYQTAMDIASLAPNAEVTVYPWKEPPELKARTIERVRTFLKAHQPVTAVR